MTNSKLGDIMYLNKNKGSIQKRGIYYGKCYKNYR